jgi:DUF4097 and DUF4098 domain-containing protein YvlB
VILHLKINERAVLATMGTAILFCVCAAGPALAAPPEQKEKHFEVKGRPTVVLRNIVDGRIEVKSSKNPEVVVLSSSSPEKVAIDLEQVGDRIDISATGLVNSTQPHEVEANFTLTVPEETELQLKTQTGLIYVEQVNGDMQLESVAGDVNLKEVSGYIIVKTTGGSLKCVQCAGKLDFASIGGGAQILQSSLGRMNLMTTTGNLLYDGDFVRTGIYTMKSTRGSVEVHFSPTDSLDVDARSLTGTVDNQAADFVRTDVHGPHHTRNRGNSFFGTVGQGLAKVELSSYSGTIRILKRP